MSRVFLFIVLTFNACIYAFAETDPASGLMFRIENDGTATIIDKGSIVSNSNLVIPSNVVAANGNTYAVKKINDRAFALNSLTSVSIPDTVTEIGRQSFAHNPNLASVSLGQNLQSIGPLAFENCGLTSISLPNSLVLILERAFLNCTLVTISFNSTIQRIDQFVFNNNKLQQLVLPASLLNMGSGVFEENSLTYVKFLGDKNTFQNNIFYNNTSLSLIEVCLEKNFPNNTVYNNDKFANTTPAANITVTPVRCSPIANAGPDQTIQDDSTPGAPITLNGGASSDDLGISAYSWSGSDGSSFAGISPNINAPVGTTVYTLTVTDADGATDSDSVSITVNAYQSSSTSSGGGSSGSSSGSSTGTGSSTSSGSSSGSSTGTDSNQTQNSAPTASILGGNYSVADTDGLPGENITVSATASDSDGVIVAYKWFVDGLANIECENNCTLPASFNVEFCCLVDGDHRIRLSVTDDKGAIFTTESVITILPPNKPPIGDAGSDIKVQDDEEPGEKVRLWAVGSDDKGIVKFEWVGSDGSKYSGARVDVIAPVGITIYTLTVTDEEGLSDTDSLSVTVLEYKPKKEVPAVPQQSLPKIARTDGAETNSTISIGSSSDDGETYNTSFNVADEVVLTAKIYPDSKDLGEEGEIYVVIRTIENGKKVFKALNEDGVWELWNASLKSLPAAKYVDCLESVEEIEIYSGSMTAGQRLIYVGYSLFTDGKPVITTSLSPLKIDVSE